jgi:hypothetical protein
MNRYVNFSSGNKQAEFNWRFIQQQNSSRPNGINKKLPLPQYDNNTQ